MAAKAKSVSASAKDRLLVATIAKYQKLYDVTLERLAIRIGMSARTLTSRTKTPSTFSLAELRRIQKTLAIPESEMLDVLL